MLNRRADITQSCLTPVSLWNSGRCFQLCIWSCFKNLLIARTIFSCIPYARSMNQRLSLCMLPLNDITQYENLSMYPLPFLLKTRQFLSRWVTLSWVTLDSCYSCIRKPLNNDLHYDSSCDSSCNSAHGVATVKGSFFKIDNALCPVI